VERKRGHLRGELVMFSNHPRSASSRNAGILDLRGVITSIFPIRRNSRQKPTSCATSFAHRKNSRSFAAAHDRFSAGMNYRNHVSSI